MSKVCGICVGAANLTSVELSLGRNGIEVVNVSSLSHQGNIYRLLRQRIEELRDAGYEYIAVTGRKSNDSLTLPWISEPEAVERAFKFVNKDQKEFNAVVSMGAELFIAYVLDKQGNISGVRTLNKCASGTGEFFMQQLRRMNVGLEEAVKLAYSENIYRVSSRCSVFCKSDCTHALNKGRDLGDILAGLCDMMATKVMELLVNLPKENIMLIGGVALNSRVVESLKKNFRAVFVPKEAAYFEALGAGLWIMENKISFKGSNLFKDKKSSSVYSILPPLEKALPLVDYKDSWKKEDYKAGDRCIIGLDVGSTTTKAVMLRVEDNAVLDSIYLRTNGNPIEAARNCYRVLDGNIKEKIRIIGLGVTGSGRQIVALHASSDGIVNEIIAHAVAAVYFDPEVDTIFEIGGQDAKYTHITNMVPSDYAMNEACSAGTGSFLEESCKETLSIDVREIESYALKSSACANFNDQCAAFISSDIKAACYDGMKKEDIVSGLVYSICMNYNNRVKGNRVVGKKIFMQGGVCYNKAVPLAMAALLNKKIIVPPEPGLMGAFGVALEIKNKINRGVLKEAEFDLKELLSRQVKNHGSFKCKGGVEKCDRGCDIARIETAGKTHLFGGACNKYYNLSHELKFDTEKLDLVKLRQGRLFSALNSPASFIGKNAKSVGINKSFLTHIFFPLYYHFFSALGMKVVVSDTVLDHGVQRKGASFCYPAEIAHGLFQHLLELSLDYIFLPQILELKAKKIKHVRKEQQSTCVILQSEPYYLRSTFKDFDKKKLLIPVMDFSKGRKTAEKSFLQLARGIGFGKEAAFEAFDLAYNKQNAFFAEMKQLGRNYLEELENNPDKIGIVVLGRAYNALAAEANMAIPDKFASRGITVIPFDCLPFEEESDDRHMYWATGQMLLKASRFIKRHPRLFAVFITNFSCGPDSFIVGNVRDIMGRKPMLILEIDSHTADAGITTRVEAFLDIVNGSRHIKEHKDDQKKERFTPARCVSLKKSFWVISSQRERLKITDPKVKLLIPPMGELGPQALSAAFRAMGVNAETISPSDGISLNYGRANTTCKECLPLILTAGGLIKYTRDVSQNGDVLVYFMPSTGGNCRFGQYHFFLKNLIRKQRMKNLAVWAIDTQNGYIGLGAKFNTLALKAVIVSDIMYDIKNTLKVLAEDRKAALEVFIREWQKIIYSLENKGRHFKKQLEKTAFTLKQIPLKYPLKEAKSVALMGEIYVRRDDFCCDAIIERLAQKGFVLKTAPAMEWFYYVDYLVKEKLIESNFGLSGKIEFAVKNFLQKKAEKEIKWILAKSGLYENEPIEIEKIMSLGKHLIDQQVTGESIVVIGAALKEIMHSVCGVINVGPFACLPTRIIESILSYNMNLETKIKAGAGHGFESNDIDELSFLSIEVDGNPFSLLIDAKIEAFCLQAERLHKKIRNFQSGHAK